MATRRYGTIVRHLSDDPDTASELAAKLSGDVLHHLAEALHDEARRRAIRAGDLDALIADTFEKGFGRDGLGVDPWIHGDVVVCPEVAATQAGEHAGNFEDEIALLIVHGILHVLGHDHAEPGETLVMRERELDLLQRFHWHGPTPDGFRQEQD